MGKRGPQSSFDIEKIKSLQKEGLSNAAIGRELGTTGQNIGKLLTRHANTKENPKQFLPETVSKKVVQAIRDKTDELIDAGYEAGSLNAEHYADHPFPDVGNREQIDLDRKVTSQLEDISGRLIRMESLFERLHMDQLFQDIGEIRSRLETVSTETVSNKTVSVRKPRKAGNRGTRVLAELKKSGDWMSYEQIGSILGMKGSNVRDAVWCHLKDEVETETRQEWRGSRLSNVAYIRVKNGL